MVVLALAALGLHAAGSWPVPGAAGGLLFDLLWPVPAGLVVGASVGRLLGAAMRAMLRREHPLAWDELLYLGTIAVAYSTASLLRASTFLAVFACGCAMFPTRVSPAGPQGGPLDDAQALARRMVEFGARIERLMEVLTVLLIGAALASVRPTLPMLLFALSTIFVARPRAEKSRSAAARRLRPDIRRPTREARCRSSSKSCGKSVMVRDRPPDAPPDAGTTHAQRPSLATGDAGRSDGNGACRCNTMTSIDRPAEALRERQRCVNGRQQ